MTAATGSYSGMRIMGTRTAVQNAAEAISPAIHLHAMAFQHVQRL